jgi:hypothetical protein
MPTAREKSRAVLLCAQRMGEAKEIAAKRAHETIG